MKNGRNRTGNRRHDPHPIRWTSLSRSQFVFVVFHKRFGRSVMVHYRYVVRLTRIENSHFNVPVDDQRESLASSSLSLSTYLETVQHRQVDFDESPVFFQKPVVVQFGFHAVQNFLEVIDRKLMPKTVFWEGEPAGFPLPSALTSNTLYLCGSHKFLHPISELMYQPLNGHAVNWIPPQSNSIPDTAGRQYHRRPKSANQSNLQVGRCYVMTSH